MSSGDALTRLAAASLFLSTESLDDSPIVTGHIITLTPFEAVSYVFFTFTTTLYTLPIVSTEPSSNSQYQATPTWLAPVVSDGTPRRRIIPTHR